MDTAVCPLKCDTWGPLIVVDSDKRCEPSLFDIEQLLLQAERELTTCNVFFLLKRPCTL